MAVARSFGASYRQAAVAPLDESAVTPTIRLADGTPARADHYVFACGPWLPRLFPTAVGSRVRPTR